MLTVNTMASTMPLWAVSLVVILMCSGRIGGGNANSISGSTTVTDKFNDVLRDEDNILVDISSLAKAELSSSSSSSSSSSASTEDNNGETVLPLEDQVRLLSKQMSALMNRRREDYKMLENSLKKSVRQNSVQFGDSELRSELVKLR